MATQAPESPGSKPRREDWQEEEVGREAPGRILIDEKPGL